MTLWPPPAEAVEPWLRSATVKFTGLPAAGLAGDQATGAATRSEPGTGRTVSGVALVQLLLDSSCSITAFASSAFAVSG